MYSGRDAALQRSWEDYWERFYEKHHCVGGEDEPQDDDDNFQEPEDYDQPRILS